MPQLIYIYTKENTEKVSNVQKQTVHTINRKQKEDKHDDHFDHSNQNERFRSDRTKPCNLVDDANELKAVGKKDTPPNIKTS